MFPSEIFHRSDIVSRSFEKKNISLEVHVHFV